MRTTRIVILLVLLLRSSAKMRNFAGRITRSRFLQPAVYWVQFIIAVYLLTFPLTVYEAYYREHKYGLLNQTFGPWLREQLIMLAVNLVLGAIFLTLLFWVVRRLGRNWWVWSAVVVMV